MGFITTPDGDAQTLADGEDETGQLYTDAEAGTFGTLLPGQGFEPFNPDYPSAMFADFVKCNLRGIASGMGVTYEMMTGDVREVNFSSARVSMLEFRRNAEQMQWLTLIPRLCEPIWRAFVDAASMAGSMKPKDYAVDWSTPKWSYVNPEQDVKADLAAVSGGFTSISEILRRQGYKPELVFAEMKSDFDRLRKDGTLDVMLQLQTNQAPQQPAAPAKTAS